MKHNKAKIQALRTIATHSIVAAVFSNPYLLYLIADAYRVVINDTSAPTADPSLAAAMGLVSTTAFFVAVIALSVAVWKSKK
jgi:hypothetical protein